MFRENQELEMGMSRGAHHPEAPMSGKGRQGDGKSLNLSSEDRHPKTARSDSCLLTKLQCPIGMDQEVSGLPQLDDSETP